MLIIAIPKSASTSLLHTLGEIHKMEVKQDVVSVKDNQIPPDFRLLRIYHSDCRTLISENVKKWNSPDRFYKQHIPPIRQNLDLLNHLKKVILLRDPKEIILAYRRAETKGLHKTRTELRKCETERDWLDKAKEIGLYDELQNFYKGRVEASTNKHLIHFDDLISDDVAVFKVVSGYFNFSTSDSDLNGLQLKKFRYSRHNIIQKYAHKVVERLKNIFTSI